MLTEDITARVFLSIAIIIVIARIFGVLARKVRQPAVVGEIIAGICLGPSVLGLINEDLPEKLFPLEVRPFLGIIAQLGLIIFMFIVGLELDMNLIRGKGRLAAVTSVSSVILPFTLGIAASVVLHDAYGVVNGEEVEWLHFALFLGASMSVTAFPVLARILTERRMHRTRLGVLVLACAAVDDILAWSLLAAVLTIVGESHLEAHWVVILTLLYGAGMIFLIRPLLQKVVDRYQEIGRLTPDILAVVLVGVLVSSYLTSEIGIHAIFGAFFFGAIFPREGAHQLFHEILERLEQVTVLLLLPVFFVITGLNVDITGLGTEGLGYLLLVLAVACTGKFVGAAAAARSQGVPPRQAMAIGVLMNTRGLTELVILSIGLEVGILNEAMFTIMVVMAVFTTVITEPLLRVLYPDELVQREIDEAERFGSEQALAFRVLVGTPEGDPGPLLARLATELTDGEEPREVDLVQFGHRPRQHRGGRRHRGPGHVTRRPPHAGDQCRSVRRPDVRRARGRRRIPVCCSGSSPTRTWRTSYWCTTTPPTARRAEARPPPRRRPVSSSPTGRRPPTAPSRSTCEGRRTTSTPSTSAYASPRPGVVRVTLVQDAGSPGRKLNASLARLRTSGRVIDAGSTAGIRVYASEAPSRERDVPTLVVRAGRDDGIERLAALVERLGQQTSEPSP